MAKYREFYVQSGAGMNYLALKCLWTDNMPEPWKERTVAINEFHSHISQIKINNKDKRIYHQTSTLSQFNDDEYLMYESKRILPILIELKNMSKQANTVKFDRIITEVKNNTFWKSDEFLNWAEIQDDSREHWLAKKEATKYFTNCREYYYSIFERNDWDCFNMAHQHPCSYAIKFPRLKLPTTFKSLAMELDVDMSFYSDKLYDIKNEEYKDIRKDHIGVGENHWAYKENLLAAYKENIIMCTLSDDTVSYRKIFFENDSDEIRKMYAFFDNEEYFDKNKMSIMKEFKEYHEDNMVLMQKFAPDFIPPYYQ